MRKMIALTIILLSASMLFAQMSVLDAFELHDTTVRIGWSSAISDALSK